MGKESQCTCRWNDQSSSGTALLETDEILFRGSFRLSIPLKQIRTVVADAGQLRIEAAQGNVSFALGTAAEKWAQRILHPPGRLDKLGVKPGSRVAIVGLDDPEFHAEIAASQAVLLAKQAKQCDLVFLGVENRNDLKKVPAAKRRIASAGGLWIVYPKGIKTITEADVRASAYAAGLVDVKVARFSDRLTALKFVIPVADRT